MNQWLDTDSAKYVCRQGCADKEHCESKALAGKPRHNFSKCWNTVKHERIQQNCKSGMYEPNRQRIADAMITMYISLE